MVRSPLSPIFSPRLASTEVLVKVHIGKLKEVVGAQVLVALGRAGVDAGDLDDDVRGRLGQVGDVQVGAGREVAERATHLRDHGLAVVGAGQGGATSRFNHLLPPLPGNPVERTATLG